MSIFELRTVVKPGAGLGATVSRVRAPGRFASRNERAPEASTREAARLPADVEVEILRIVQEAVTNARRHSRAKELVGHPPNIPPGASVRVADDGEGIIDRRWDSYGMEIMRERAVRIGGRLDVRSRVGGGTVIDLILGEPVSQSPRGTQDTGMMRSMGIGLEAT